MINLQYILKRSLIDTSVALSNIPFLYKYSKIVESDECATMGNYVTVNF